MVRTTGILTRPDGTEQTTLLIKTACFDKLCHACGLITVHRKCFIVENVPSMISAVQPSYPAKRRRMDSRMPNDKEGKASWLRSV
jgi:hypothetical protein